MGDPIIYHYRNIYLTLWADYNMVNVVLAEYKDINRYNLLKSSILIVFQQIMGELMNIMVGV